MRLYNTLTREKEELKPVEPGKVKVYTCGPTVYMFAHIGNFRSFIFADLLRRGLEYLDYEVEQVMNVTDVGHLTDDEDSGEDKFEVSARREGKTPDEIAAFYEQAFWQDAEKVNMLKPTRVCHATKHIDDMIELVRRIEANGFAYRTSVGLIYDTAKFPGYAELARLNLDEQQAGARTTVDPERRNASDFALWISNQPRHLMQWDSPWGRGFPGWHLECSAMSTKYLGERFDIHTGGIDHIPVHHTNERAQNFAATDGKPVVNVWLHGAFLTIGDARMGKSEGNLITVSQLEERGFGPTDFRYLCLTALYRTPLSFTTESITSARNSLRGLVDFGCLARGWDVKDDGWTAPLMAGFRSAIADDLNLPQALAVVWNLAREGRKREDGAAWRALLDFDRVLGLGLEKLAEVSAEVPDEVQRLAEERQQARAAKDWARADELRDRIAELGFVVEDTPDGPRAKPRA